MVPFPIAFALKETPVKLLIEQLDRLADEKGYIRFNVRYERRRAVIFVNIEVQSILAALSRDTKGLLGSLNHLTQPVAFSFDNTYSSNEVILIGFGIRAHLNEMHYVTKRRTLLL